MNRPALEALRTRAQEDLAESKRYLGDARVIPAMTPQDQYWAMRGHIAAAQARLLDALLAPDDAEERAFIAAQEACRPPS